MTISEHAWARERFESHLAGGLSPEEAGRFEAHVASCEPCREQLAEASAFDDSMQRLFAGVGPEPGLEDRVIQAVTAAPARLRVPRALQFAAAIVLLGALGVVVQSNERMLSHFEEGLLADSTGVTHKFLSTFQGGAGPVVERVSDGVTLDEFYAIPSAGRSVLLPDQQAQQVFLSLQDESRSMGKELTRGGTGGESKDRPGREVTFGDKGVEFTLEEPRKPVGGEGDQWTGYIGKLNRAASQPDAPKIKDIQNEELALEKRVSDPVIYEAERTARTETPNDEESGGKRGRYGPAVTYSPVTPYNFFSLQKNPPPDGDAEGKMIAQGGGQGKGQGKGAAVPIYTYRNEGPAAQDKPAPEAVTKAPVARASEKPEADAAKPAPKAAAPLQDPSPEPHPAQRRIIRTGVMEFEVDSFDSAVERVSNAVVKEGGLIATVNSDRLANGKVQGTVVLRVPPDALDRLVLMLRLLGDLKSQKIAAQDVTKQYTDVESRLRAARTMEERLLQVIREAKGEVKDLLEVERELGVWRQKIEEMEGEIRYYNNLISLSTLTLTLTERDIRTPSAASLQEKVDMGVEAADVPAAYREAKVRIEDPKIKGRVVQSDLKVLEGGRMNANVTCEVPAENAGRLRDLLAGLGRLARLDVVQQRSVEGGTGPAAGVPLKQLDTSIRLSLFNMTGAQPRETLHLAVACADVEKVHEELRALAAKAGRVVDSSVNRQKSDQVVASLRCELPSGEAGELLLRARGAGEVLSLEKTVNPDAQNVTESKQGISLALHAVGSIAPRETVTLQLASADVPNAYRTVQAKALEWGGRVIDARLNEQNRDHVTGFLDFDVPRAKEADLTAQLLAHGAVLTRNAARSADTANTIDSKIRIQASLVPHTQIPPREAVKLAIETSQVEAVFEKFQRAVLDRKGRLLRPSLARQADGRVLGRLVADVPLRDFAALVETFKAAGTVRVIEASRSSDAPEGELATGRVDVTVGSGSLIIPGGEGVGAKLHRGLSTSFSAVMWSVNMILIGLAFTLPWALVGGGVWWGVRRARTKTR